MRSQQEAISIWRQKQDVSASVVLRMSLEAQPLDGPMSRPRQGRRRRFATVPSMKTFETLADLAACVGQDVAVSDWITIAQEQVNLFAQATGDHQWIHVDVERARQGPFGAPVAHGFLTLSLLPAFFESAMTVRQSSIGVNYGLNKVRFTAPVPVGSRLRAHLRLLSAEPIAGHGLQMCWAVSVEREGLDKPVCVAESLVRRYP
jgi:acyl dehydratase